ncbi:MAG: hypothetical protein AB8B85_09895 [Paracoccaceae bacterium]
MPGNYVLVATPTAGNLVSAGYASTLIGFARAARDVGWDFDNLAFDGADVVMARNFLANHVLRDRRVTHMLFLDSDMRVQQPVIARFLVTDKPMLGAVYPRRQIDLGRYGAALKAGSSEDEARALAMDFNVKIAGSSMRVNDGICEVEGLGFGCVIIRRDLLERMVEAGVAPKVRSGVLKGQGLGDTHFDFFSTLPLEGGGYLSEDYSFCARVRQMEGGQVWAYIGAGVAHLGAYSYDASFETQLMARQQAAKPHQTSG